MIKWDGVPAEELVEFALEQEKINRGQRPWLVNGLMPESYQTYAKGVLEHTSSYPILHYQFWTAVDYPTDDPDDLWVSGFPHNHKYDGVTLITFIQVPDEGGEAVVFNDDMTVKEEVKPEVGASSLVYDHEVHGVRAVRGNTPRIILIAGSFEHEKHICRCAADWVLWTNRDTKAVFN